MASKLAWLGALDLEADNIRMALRRCLDDPDAADLGLTMAAGLGQYWRTRAVSEGAHWIDALLDRQGGDDAIRGEALFVKVDLSVVQGDHAGGLDAAAEAGAIARRLHADVCWSGSSPTRPRFRSLGAMCPQLARRRLRRRRLRRAWTMTWR